MCDQESRRKVELKEVFRDFSLRKVVKSPPMT